MSKSKQAGGVTIGNVSGDIKGSVIAGGDVRGVTITIDGRPVAADKEPNIDELRKLLVDIQRQLAELVAQGEALSKLSPSATLVARSAEVSVKDAVDSFKPEPAAHETKSIKARLTEATSFMTTLLDGAKSIADKTTEVGKSVQPVIEKATPLLEKLTVAAAWAARLWV